MNSFNHYAYGAIGEWMYRVAAGLEVDPDAPGYQHILIQPQPGGGFTSIRAALDSRYGMVGSAWERQNGQMRLTVTVPANTHATVRLPAARLESVTENGRLLSQTDGIAQAHQDGDQVIVEVGSGEYVFVYPVVG
jgi:alpha-L-rhamnosidase